MNDLSATLKTISARVGSSAAAIKIFDDRHPYGKSSRFCGTVQPEAYLMALIMSPSTNLQPELQELHHILRVSLNSFLVSLDFSAKYTIGNKGYWGQQKMLLDLSSLC